MRTHIKRTYSNDVDPDTVIADLLTDRNIEDIDAFVNPKHPRDIPLESFFDKEYFNKNWKKTLDLLKKIYDDEGMIVVYTDYDADGVTGGAVMWEALNRLGFKVMPYIPDRSEGYGFSKEGIDKVIQKHDPQLIISVDHGIVGHEEVEYAASKDVPIIITDHHHKQDSLPDAHAIFHTPDLSGSGVAYFFAKELADEMDKKLPRDHVGIAAIGTVADLVPLTGVNRSVAKYGIEELQATSRTGFRQLLKDAGVDQNDISTYHIGFIIAPRINAFGRLEHAMDALRLLCTTSYERASSLARRAGNINSLRQDKVKQAAEEAEAMLDPANLVFVLQSDTWEEGIIGLIASQITKKYHRPTIVMARNDNHAKASVRSIDGIHITNFLKDLEHHLVDMGGHAAAAGFTIKTDNIDDFIRDLNDKAATEIMDEDLVPQQTIDVQLPISSVTRDMIHKIDDLKPFGIDHPRPKFASFGVVDSVKPIGKKGNHRALKFQHESGPLQAVYFNVPDDADIEENKEYAMTYDVRIDNWKGRSYPKLYIKKLTKNV